jgi:hypothetical protein
VVDHTLRDLPHREPQVHRGLLDPAERVRLAQAELLLQHALGPVDGLAGLQSIGQPCHLGLELGELLEAAHRQLDRRHQVADVERLDQIGHRPGVPGPFHQLALGERGQHHHRRNPLPGDVLGGGDAVQDRHLHVEDDQVGPQLLGEPDRLLPVTGLADDVVPLLGEHLLQVHPDQDLVLGDDDAVGLLQALGHVRQVRASG